MEDVARGVVMGLQRGAEGRGMWTEGGEREWGRRRLLEGARPGRKDGYAHVRWGGGSYVLFSSSKTMWAQGIGVCVAVLRAGSCGAASVLEVLVWLRR